MKVRISPSAPPLEEPFDEWLLQIEREICAITGATHCESIDVAGGPMVGDRQAVVFVVEIPDLLPSMRRKLADAYSIREGDSAVWRGPQLILPAEPSADSGAEKQ